MDFHISRFFFSWAFPMKVICFHYLYSPHSFIHSKMLSLSKCWVPIQFQVQLWCLPVFLFTAGPQHRGIHRKEQSTHVILAERKLLRGPLFPISNSIQDIAYFPLKTFLGTFFFPFPASLVYLSLFFSPSLSLSLFWVVLGIKVRASCFLGRHYYHLSHTPAFFAFICFDRVSRFCLEPGLGPSSSYLYLLSNWNYRCESLYQALSLFLDSI
jgi:hypothetical protein